MVEIETSYAGSSRREGLSEEAGTAGFGNSISGR